MRVQLSKVDVRTHRFGLEQTIKLPRLVYTHTLKLLDKDAFLIFKKVTISIIRGPKAAAVSVIHSTHSIKLVQSIPTISIKPNLIKFCTFIRIKPFTPTIPYSCKRGYAASHRLKYKRIKRLKQLLSRRRCNIILHQRRKTFFPKRSIESILSK